MPHHRLSGTLLIALASATMAHADPPDTPQRQRRGVTLDKARPWPGNTVVYSLSSAGRIGVELFLAAARHIAKQTPVRFVERSNESDFVYVTSTPGMLSCSSELGHTSGPQRVELNASCDLNLALHELMHTLGFLHEYQRPDRDRHIRLPPNDPSHDIPAGATALDRYDHDSVTIASPERYPARDRHTPVNEERNALSAGDIAAIRHLYPARSNLPVLPLPGFNGLTVSSSKRYLILEPGQRRRVILSPPPGDYHVTVRTFDPRLVATSTSLPSGDQALDIQATPESEDMTPYAVLAEFTPRQGPVLVAHVTVEVTRNSASRSRQLVSALNGHCLEAYPSTRTRRSGIWRHSHLDMPELDMKVRLARCDAESSLQLWDINHAGRLSVSSGHYLVPARTSPGYASLTLNRPDIPENHAQTGHWSYRNGTISFSRLPDASLSHSPSDTPTLMPATERIWQTWYWY